MALNLPYCTLSEADSYLEGSSSWESAEDEAKNTALFWGRVYIDSNYSCPSLTETNVSDEIKYANALLAEDYIEGTLLPSSGSKKPSITSKRSKAGPVESEIKYAGSYKENPQQDVDSLLNNQCTKLGANLKIMSRR